MTEQAISMASLERRIWRQTIQGTGVLWSLVWLGLILTMGVFAPFLANSIPILMSKDGILSAPLFGYLSHEDIFIPLLTLLILVLTMLRLTLWLRAALLLSGVLVIIGMILWLHKEPELIDYAVFRSLQYTQVDWRIMPLIPYAPEDRLRGSCPTSLPQPPTLAHPLGTLSDCADVASRTIYAARVAINVGLIATGIALIIGVVIGGLMGYYSGMVDLLGMRFVEIFETIPRLFLMLTIVALYGPSLYMMMVVIGLTGWPEFVRYVRAEFLKLRRIDYVQAAVAGGLPLSSILFRHMLPNAMAPLLVVTSFNMAEAILAEVTLSYLGLTGVDTPSWGAMLNKAVAYHEVVGAWWLIAFPGAAIFLTSLAFILISEALRDAIDPKSTGNAI